MKKASIITILIIAGLILLIQSGVANDLLLFLLVGAIPGTHYSIPSNVMFLTMVGLSWIVLLRFTLLEAIVTYIKRRAAKPELDHKKRMPRRRFSEI